jgi:hypothetical protein
VRNFDLEQRLDRVEALSEAALAASQGNLARRALVGRVRMPAYIEFSLTHTLLVGDEAASVLVSLSVNGPPEGTEMSVTNPFGMFSGDGHEPTGGSGSGYDVGRRGMAVDWGDGVFRIIQMECD